MSALPVTVKPTEYIAIPDGFVYPTEYIAMPAAEVQQSATSLVTNEAPAPVAVIARSGESLIQIETDPGRFSSAATIASDNTEQRAPRRRTRQHEVYVENEPLVQIETQRPQA